MKSFHRSRGMKEIIEEIGEELKVTKNEAELIAATLLGCPRFEIYLKGKLNEETQAVLMMKLKQLKCDMPIEYITKKVQFLDLSLKIHPGVFIPRLETEYFVELIKKNVNFNPQKILEIGTGCGAIAIGLARFFPNAWIIATDISLCATANASENIRHLKLHHQISLIQNDLLKGISAKFDLIISNPPYVPTERLKFLPKGVKEFEPLEAIDGGLNGVQVIKKILDPIYDYLNPGGGAAFEIDEDVVPILNKYLTDRGFSFFFKKDLFNRYRYLFIGNFKE